MLNTEGNCWLPEEEEHEELSEVLVNLLLVIELSHPGVKFKLLLSGDIFFFEGGSFQYTARMLSMHSSVHVSACEGRLPPSSAYNMWCERLALCRADRLLCAGNKRKA